MTLSDVLLWYARRGLCSRFRDSAFRKYCRRNAGQKLLGKGRSGFPINCVIGDSVDDMIYVHGVFEPETTSVIEALAPTAGFFIDVGCNIGYYSCLFRHLNRGVPLFSIDPNPAMIARTRENLELNRAANYTLHNVGIAAAAGVLRLNIPRHRHSLSSFAYKPSRGAGGAVDELEVQVLPLFDAVDIRSQRGGLVKIDTEGFECEVLAGIREDLVANLDYVIFELSARNLGLAAREPRAVFASSWMSEFRTYNLDSGPRLTLCRPDDLPADVETNILLVRREIDLSQTGLRRFLPAGA